MLYFVPTPPLMHCLSFEFQLLQAFISLYVPQKYNCLYYNKFKCRFIYIILKKNDGCSHVHCVKAVEELAIIDQSHGIV